MKKEKKIVHEEKSSWRYNEGDVEEEIESNIDWKLIIAYGRVMTILTPFNLTRFL